MTNELDLRPFKMNNKHDENSSHWRVGYYDNETHEFITIGMANSRDCLVKSLSEFDLDFFPPDADIQITKISLGCKPKYLAIDDIKVGQFFTTKGQFLADILWFKGKQGCVSINNGFNVLYYEDMNAFNIENVYEIDDFIF